MIKRVLVPTVLAALLLVPQPLCAQQGLSDLLVKLIQFDITLTPPLPGQISHEGHYQAGPGLEPSVDPTQASYVFNQVLGVQLTTFPIGSSSRAFSHVFNPDLGGFERTTESFGPIFAERALTIGRRRLGVGLDVQHSHYDSFRGKELQDGAVKFYLRHFPFGAFLGRPPVFFEGDLVEAALKLKLSKSQAVFSANYGVTNAFDVGIVVPIVHVNMDAAVEATILRLATGSVAASQNTHQFPDGGTTAVFTAKGSATGIGDVVLSSKYRFFSEGQGGLAAGLHVRLPTGDSENLLGTGAKQATVNLIGSTASGRIASHFNIGYTFSGRSNVATIPDEFDYRGGIEIPVNPRLTLTADFVGRAFRNMVFLRETDTVFDFVNMFGVPNSIKLAEFQPVSGTLHSVLETLGGTFNITRNLLISVNVLIPLNSSGLRTNVTPAVGLAYAF